MNDQELLRYNRHILLPQIDIPGQEKICASRVLVVGLGGLGSPVAMYLAASGVGELVLVDDDVVDESNLQRQIVHNESTLGKNKVDSAKVQLQALNSNCMVDAIPARLSAEDLAAQIHSADVVVDCCDNFETRNLVNELCFAKKKPLVSGAAVRLEGQLTVFDFRSESSPCYSCLFEVNGEENLSCSENGVLAPLVGVVGSAQALEVIKLLVGFGKSLVGRLALYDAGRGEWRYFNYGKNAACKVCGK